MRFYSFDKDNSIINLSNSILKRYGVKPFHSTIEKVDELIKDKKKICLVLLDGFGASIQNKYLDKNHPFIKNRVMEISSTFPPTTVAATTGLLTGKYGCETGWIAWTTYLKDYDTVVEMFTNKDYLLRTKLAEDSVCYKLYPTTSIFELIREKNPNIFLGKVEHGDFSNEAFDTSEEMFEVADKTLSSFDEGFYIVYDTEPDHEFHQEGLDSQSSKDLAMKLVDKVLELVERHKDTFFIVISDHSHLNSSPIFLEDYPDIMEMIKGSFVLEGRAASFRIKEGYEDKFLKRATELWSKDFDIVSKQYLIDNHVFGFGKTFEGFEDVLGQHTLIAVSDKFFKMIREENRPPLKSNHGGGTKEENIIALISFNNETSTKI